MTGKILITGITGFIGRNLAEYLLQNGYEVYGIDRAGNGVEGVRVYKCDILNPKGMEKAAKDIDVIVHLAALSFPPKASLNPFLAYDTNFIGTYNMLKVFKKNKCEKFVFASSAKVYGTPSYLPINEDHPLRPSTVYGRSKMLAEDVINAVGGDSGGEFAIIRQFNIFGRNQSKDFLLPSIIGQIRNCNVLRVGNASIRRDFLYIDDLLRAYKIIIEKKLNGINVFNVGSGESHSVREIIEDISGIINKKIEIIQDKSKFRNEHIEEYANISKIKGLGWKPEISLEEGLRKLILDSP